MSRSSDDGRMQMQSYYPSGRGPSTTKSNVQDFKCYSASYASSVHPTQTQVGNDLKLKKGKLTNAVFLKSGSFIDPELQRQKIVAGYKVYFVEGKVKGPFRKSFKWIKERCSRAVSG